MELNARALAEVEHALDLAGVSPTTRLPLQSDVEVCGEHRDCLVQVYWRDDGGSRELPPGDDA